MRSPHLSGLVPNWAEKPSPSLICDGSFGKLRGKNRTMRFPDPPVEWKSNMTKLWRRPLNERKTHLEKHLSALEETASMTLLNRCFLSTWLHQFWTIFYLDHCKLRQPSHLSCCCSLMLFDFLLLIWKKSFQDLNIILAFILSLNGRWNRSKAFQL